MLPLIILSGPTASGKSKIALALAEHLGAEIISADSMQVYRHFDIGTAKPSPEERRRVTHHLIDILEPEEEFTAYKFKERALECIRDIRSRDRIPVMVGGTGLYLKTLLDNRECAIAVSSEVRRQVQDEIRRKGTREMHAELSEIDPVYAGKIQPTDPSRIERALSVHRETGKKFSEFHADDEAPPDYEFESHMFVLETDRSHLYNRIEARVEGMIEEGLKTEVETLLNRGYDPRLKPFQSIGYSQIVRHLTGELPLDQAVYEIKRETRHFAKRQLTWFRKMTGRLTLPFEPGETTRQIKEKILERLPLCAAFLFCAWMSLGPVSQTWATGEDRLWPATHSYHSGQWGKARSLLEKLLLAGADRHTQKRARFLLGKIYIHQREFAPAKALFERALLEYPELGDYIQFELARINQAEGNWEATLTHTSALLKKYPLTLLAPAVHLIRADVYEELGEPKNALKELALVEGLIGRKFSTSQWKTRLPEIVNRQIVLAKQLKDHPLVYGLYRKLYIRYPTIAYQHQAKIQMDRMVQNYSLTPRPLTEREGRRRIRALLSKVAYRQVIQEIRRIQKDLKGQPLPPHFYFYQAAAYKGLRDRPQANTVLRRFLREYPGHPRGAEAHFLIAGNLWNLGNPEGALLHIETLLKSFPNSYWIPQALFYQGRIYEDIRSPARAVQTYQTLIRRYHQEPQAEMGAWRSGWIPYQAGKIEKAYLQFKENLSLFTKGNLTDKHLFWMAKAAEDLNRKPEALSLFRDLANRFPYTYYGQQARHHLARISPDSIEASTPFTKASYSTPKKVSYNDPGRRLSSREKFHFMRASELIEMGFYEEAQTELFRLGRSIRKNLSGVLWLSHWYNRAQGYAHSQKILHLIKDLKTIHREKELPREFWINFYPTAYSEFIKNEAGKYGLDPWLVKGLIRQESMYNTRSLSPAGARGLMQIMPKTGKRLYAHFHPDQSFENDFLFHPEVNLRLGIKYLSELNRKYKGNGVYILISYNAGPKVLSAWRTRFRSIKDRDIFVESIPYPETRSYVKHIIRNYGIYKNLYPTSSTKVPENKSF